MRLINSISYLRGAVLACLLISCSTPEPETPLPDPGVDPLRKGAVTWLDPNQPETWDADTKPFILFMHTRRSSWSGEMVDESFTTNEIVSEINALTRPVWIDADLRPDLVDRWSLGALPSLAILTAKREWITGTTFLGREDMAALLRRIRILSDIPERMEDLERERGRLLKRRPYRQLEAARSLDPDALLDMLVGSMLKAEVAARSGEAQLLLVASGYRDQTADWLRLHASERQLNADGLFVASLRTDDGFVRDEMTSLGHNAGLLYTMAALADLTGDAVLKKRSCALAEAIVTRLYNATDAGFRAGTADYILRDTTITQTGGASLVPTDRRYITAWNALTVSALCRVARLDPDSFTFSDVMKLSLDRTLSEAVDHDDVFRTRAHTNARTLEDAAQLIRACLDYADVSGNQTYAGRAEALADHALRSLEASAAQPDSVTGPLSGIVVGADAEFGAPAGVFAQALYRLSGDPVGPRADRAEVLVRHAILTNAERLPRMGAVGRALLDYRSRGSEIR